MRWFTNKSECPLCTDSCVTVRMHTGDLEWKLTLLVRRKRSKQFRKRTVAGTMGIVTQTEFLSANAVSCGFGAFVDVHVFCTCVREFVCMRMCVHAGCAYDSYKHTVKHQFRLIEMCSSSAGRHTKKTDIQDQLRFVAWRLSERYPEANCITT